MWVRQELGKKGMKSLNSMDFCYYRCRWEYPSRNSFFSQSSVFVVGFLLVLSTFGFLFARLTISPFEQPHSGLAGCQEHSEGSWSIGFFRGSTPFSLQPIEMLVIYPASGRLHAYVHSGKAHCAAKWTTKMVGGGGDEVRTLVMSKKGLEVGSAIIECKGIGEPEGKIPDSWELRSEYFNHRKRQRRLAGYTLMSFL